MGNLARGVRDGVRSAKRSLWQRLDRTLRSERGGGVGVSSAGVEVSYAAAMGHDAFYAAVNRLATDVAKLDRAMYEELPRGGSVIRRDHYLHPVVSLKGNVEMTAQDVVQTAVGHHVALGTAALYKERNGWGETIGLWPLNPYALTPYSWPKVGGSIQDDAVRWWEYVLPSGEPRILQHSDLLIIRGLGYDGRTGYSLVDLHRDTIGVGLAQKRFQADFFANDMVPRMIVTMPEGVALEDPEEDAREIKERINRTMRAGHGLTRHHCVSVLDRGMGIEVLSANPEQSQLTQSQQEVVLSVCRLTGVPPHKLAILKDAHHKNIEHQNLEYWQDAILPICERLEHGVRGFVLLPREAVRIYLRHNLAPILRSDFKTRMEGYRICCEIGLYSLNELRGLEDLPPVEGGDQRFVPANWRALTGGTDEDTVKRQLLDALDRRGFDVPDLPDGLTGEQLARRVMLNVMGQLLGIPATQE
jgi:HK97 family phage portal protein